jgi:LacI family transcriptional regulator
VLTRKRPTIREIASEAGVSVATVSRVMNNPAAVLPDTRAAVQRVIERNGYLSHAIAVSLASARSLSIGLVIPSITNSIYASSTQAIQAIAQGAGYTVLLGVSEFSPVLEEKLIRQLLARRVDGLILTGGERDPRLYELIDTHGIPFVVTWKMVDASSRRPSVSFDNHKGACMAMQHLIGLGHRRIALICGRTGVNDRARERRRAYEEAMNVMHGAFDPALICEADFELDQGRAAMHDLLDRNPSMTAVFCANDIQAIGAISECEDRGLAVPADISIIGFDDLPIAEYTRPRLTTIRVPAHTMGELAAARLLESIRTGAEVVGEELPIELVVRDSTSRLEV